MVLVNYSKTPAKSRAHQDASVVAKRASSEPADCSTLNILEIKATYRGRLIAPDGGWNEISYGFGAFAWWYCEPSSDD
jgi:hypothetical protein